MFRSTANDQPPDDDSKASLGCLTAMDGCSGCGGCLSYVGAALVLVAMLAVVLS